MAIHIVVLLRIMIFSVSSQTENYFIDYWFTDDVAYGTNFAGAPYLAYPINTCVKNGNGESGTYLKYQCSDSGDIVYRCNFGVFGSCSLAPTTLCTWNYKDVLHDLLAPSVDALNWGSCTGSGSEPHADDVGINYLEVEYYTAFQNGSRECPQNSDPLYGYNYEGYNKFATDICVEQDGGTTYLKTTCDATGGEIGIYTNSACNSGSRVGALISFSPICEYFYLGGAQTVNDQRYFRRLGGCFVNGADIVVPTSPPTPEPTASPSKSPSKNPTLSPSDNPSTSPTTIAPTTSPVPIPTYVPSDNPTTITPTTSQPTAPTSSPVTNTPTTSSPTLSPVTLAPTTEEPTEVTLIPDGTDDNGDNGLFSDPSNLSPVEKYIVIGVAAALVIGFCCCVYSCIKSRREEDQVRDIRKKIRTLKSQKQQNRQRSMQMQRMASNSGTPRTNNNV